MAPQPLVNRIGTLVQHPQFTWWCGHCIVFFCFIIHLFYWITFRASEGASFYYTAYLGAMLSYGVVIYKSFGTPAPTWEYFQKINRDENVFYLVLACVWFMNAQVFANASRFIQSWVHKNYDKAMRTVSFVEQAFSDVARFLDGMLLPSANNSIHPYIANLYRQAKSAVIWAGQFQPQSGRQTSNSQSGRFQSRANTH
ncbi:17807_t:CDS:2 [Dentiscutata erythropus]|uniref:17807_t:CDS:1 n=1 Tax=Dentiscutata erythropus TaxID=1348616 RepID=A0A9N9EBL8_9GLOM|nr:17807_t:CDS:2 [Dentiscutata erythropus]